MPREDKKRLTGRKQVNPQETFDFTVPERRINARPVDPFERVGGSSQARGILEFANNLSRTGREVTAANETYKAGQKEEGIASATRGDEAPKGGLFGKHSSFIEGYEEFKGVSAINDYHKKLNELYQQSSGLEPDDWQAKVAELNHTYINGSSDAYLKGFVPAALQLEDKYNTKYSNDLRARVKLDYLTKTNEIATSNLTRIYSDDTIKDKGAELRKVLSQEQARAKSLGMADRMEVSETFMKNIIDKAYTDGRPDYLDFAFQKDESGFRLVDRPELANDIWTGLRNAESKKITMENRAVELLEKQKKIARDKAEKEIVIALETGDYDGAVAKIKEHIGTLDSEHTQKYLKQLRDYSLESTFAPANNMNRFDEFNSAATSGLLTEKQKNDLHLHFKRETVKELLEKNASAKKSVEKYTDMHNAMKSKKKDLIDTICARDPMTGFLLDPAHQERAVFVSDEFDRRWYSWTKEHPNEPITYDVVVQWRDEIRKEAIEKWGKIADIQEQNMRMIHNRNISQSNTTQSKGGAAAAADKEQKKYNINDELDSLTMTP